MSTTTSKTRNIDAMNKPLVSVVTPFYNAEDHLVACIESVLNQTYENWEYVLLNNCSTDASGMIADSYAKKDFRIRIEHATEHVHQRANYNRAVSAISTGSEYWKVVEADNTIRPECIDVMVDVAERHPSIGFVSA